MILPDSSRRRAHAQDGVAPKAKPRDSAARARPESAKLDAAGLARLRPLFWLALTALLPAASNPRPQAGSIRGIVYDKDFDVPLAAAQVFTVETGQRATTTSQGNFVFSQVPPGRYTLVFSKDGYVRQVKADVVVEAGQLTDVEVYLVGEFTELDEFVVQDILNAAAGSEAALLKLRFESPALMDSIGAELIGRSGASDAASALRLVSGASIQDGKFAVIRGLPDRYVSSQMNGVRLPSADENKRAVELDLFPAAILESLQVSKTFTPDQQGDASGGAVNVKLRGIPDEALFQVKTQLGYNSNVGRRDDFLSYDGGGVNFWGRDHSREIQSGTQWTGAAGTEGVDAPIDWKASITAGGKHELDSGLKLGGLFSFFYERDSEFHDDGVDNSLWVVHPGDQPTPETLQGTPSDGDFKTALFDITKAEESVQWGGLGTLGIEGEHNAVALTYLYTHTAQDVATLAIDTRGKQFFFPGHDPNDPSSPGAGSSQLNSAPFLRTETLEYTERTAGTLQLHGRHELLFGECDLGANFHMQPLELDWTLSSSFADLDQPDKRQFGALWHPSSLNPGAPPFVPPFTTPATWLPYFPAANFNLGNFQRIFKTIEEDSTQYALNVKWPFEQWSGDKGYFKTGIFHDKVEREFHQETFSNFGDAGSSYENDFEHPWSAVFPNEPGHAILASDFDVDYHGEQTISATYAMVDLPLDARVNVIGGARFESTELSIVNMPEAGATWFPPGESAPVTLNPGDADVDFSQDDVLPSIGLVYKPVETVTLRGSYSETVARQTFKELTPVQQQEFLGGPVFIGNPELVMSALENYDLRCDYTPSAQSLFSLSWFQKNVVDPIEYVQRINSSFDYTTPVNYPKGKLSGIEFEVRQGLGVYTDALEGLSCGANATFIESEVTLPADEAQDLEDAGAPMKTRDMTNAPEHLYNLYVTYDVPNSGTQLGLFYTVQGDTLVAGAGENDGNFVPSVYAREYDTLNFSVSQQLGRFVKLQFQAKNLTNPEIEEVYRADTIDGDVLKTSYTKGVDYSLGLTATFSF